MRNLLIAFSFMEIAASALLLFICVFLHHHKEEKYNNRIKLGIIFISSVVVMLGLTLNDELSTPGAGLFELIILYILHTVYLADFESRRKIKDET